VSRSRKGSPRCPERKCSWCGGLASAKHRDARRMPMPWHDHFHEPRCVVASPKRMREIGRLYDETRKRGAA
jgi:hypothetical protein